MNNQIQTSLLVAALGVFAACKGEQIHAAEPAQAQRYRPAWSASLPHHVDAMSQCLEGREAPRYVLYVDSLTSGATAVSTVDAYGVIENCAVADGKVVLRQPTDRSPSDLIGLPLFSLGAQQPIVASGVLLEEVVANDLVVGWLYWPPAAAESL